MAMDITGSVATRIQPRIAKGLVMVPVLAVHMPVRELLGRRRAHARHRQLELQCLAGQRVVAVQMHLGTLDLRHVEHALLAFLAAAVVAKPDPKWGETPCAFVELKPGSMLTAQEVVAHCRKHLAGFKVPKAVVFGELPKTSTGKIQKFELRKKAGSAAAIDV